MKCQADSFYQNRISPTSKHRKTPTSADLICTLLSDRDLNIILSFLFLCFATACVQFKIVRACLWDRGGSVFFSLCEWQHEFLDLQGENIFVK